MMKRWELHCCLCNMGKKGYILFSSHVELQDDPYDAVDYNKILLHLFYF